MNVAASRGQVASARSGQNSNFTGRLEKSPEARTTGVNANERRMMRRATNQAAQVLRDLPGALGRAGPAVAMQRRFRGEAVRDDNRGFLNSPGGRTTGLARPPEVLQAVQKPSWATAEVDMSGRAPAMCFNLVAGEWRAAGSTRSIVDPLNGDHFIHVPDTRLTELKPFVDSAHTCPKYGLHNPMHNPERYVKYGEVTAKAAAVLSDPEVQKYFARLIQRVTPKHIEQAMGEVRTTKKWLETFAGDGVRQLARSFSVPGDHYGQESRGFRWPYGPVAIITPFNFPLEIPALQTLSAIFMGNRPLVKVDEKVSIVMEQFIRLLIECGMPATDLDLLYSSGPVANQLLKDSLPRMTLFTGSQNIADKLCLDMNGRIKVEDAGFDWKILGPDVQDLDYVAYQSDQDAYAFSGQKCSAQSIVFMHENWKREGFVSAIAKLASERTLENLTVCPTLSVSNETIEAHIERVSQLRGAKLLFGGRPIEEAHDIPEQYGSFQPTAMFVPIEEMLASQENFDLVNTEIFGPFQIITEYSELPPVLEAIERMEQHLTAAVVSSNKHFINSVLSQSVNGTTYVGMRGRTTGAPANHWFGPAGDPRAGGIHTIEAIQSTWSCHREIIVDDVIPNEWEKPQQT